MQTYPPTLIWRHRRENLNKCSLRFLEKRPDFQFYRYPNASLPDLTDYILLDIEAEPLSTVDGHRGLFLIDGTWRYADVMRRQLGDAPQMVRRSIPGHFRTAYPRRQDDCSDPERGLASIEALYIAYRLLGRDPQGLLDHYYWAASFLENNPSLR